jgi:DNA-binding response OmpR family regulator
MRILIVEDEPLINKTLELVLKKEGYDIISCLDGKDGMGKLSSDNPALVITDIMLPFISGLEIVSHVKKTSNTPILVLSAMGQEHIIEAAFNLGADEFMTKPFSLSELKIRVNKIMERHYKN